MIDFELTNEQMRLVDQMSELQYSVVAAILAHRHPGEAYKAAGGHSENTTHAVYQIKQLPHIKTFLKSVKHSRIKAAILTREEALVRLSNIARTSINQLANFETFEITDSFGNLKKQSTWHFKDSDEIPPEALDAILELSAGNQGLKLKLHDQKQAIKQIGEMEGWEAPKKVELNGSVETTIDVSKLSTQALIELWTAKENDPAK